MEIIMVDVTDDLNTRIDEVNMLNYNEKVNMVYHRVEDELIDFFNRCKLKDIEVMLCPCCSLVFNKKATKEVEKIIPQTYQPMRSGKQDKQGTFILDKRGIPHRVQ